MARDRHVRERHDGGRAGPSRERHDGGRAGPTPERQGRSAGPSPQRPPAGWGTTLKRVWANVSIHHLSLISAGLALYALLATFPALAAIVALYGLVLRPEEIAAQVQSLGSFVPPDVASIVETALRSLTESQGGALSVGAVIGVLLALWSARKGMEAMMTATDIAYGIDKQRSFFNRMLVSFGLTVAAVLGFVLILIIAVAVPLIAPALGLSGPIATVIGVLRWIVLWLLIVLGLAIVYRFAPNREQAHWRWITYGSATAATLWVVTSLLFSLYVQNFGSYGKTYGALGGVIVMLLWFYLSSYVLLIGAEIDATLEKQTVPELRDGRARDERVGRSARAAVH